ncbi:SH2 domain-containing protein 1B [Rhinatrema bivittatum]|uniref:SH2 domain-containing protein 1B n=1 Tax=Rhinatrema bivittatum TaxID=194408 RepID=UPI001129448B|nr:SH2 domain-containing protein 1B [Rhinatrema bivittatum]
MDLPFYHESLSKKACEDLLIQKRRNGSFLLRDSESVPGVLCLCVLFQRIIYTYRIFQNREGYFKIETAYGVKEQVFKTMKDLIANYERPNQGIRSQLRFPVLKERIRRSKMQEEYAEIEDRDYVVVLPSRQARKKTDQRSTVEPTRQPSSSSASTHHRRV